jgi:hypothetical protein
MRGTGRTRREAWRLRRELVFEAARERAARLAGVARGRRDRGTTPTIRDRLALQVEEWRSLRKPRGIPLPPVHDVPAPVASRRRLARPAWLSTRAAVLGALALALTAMSAIIMFSNGPGDGSVAAALAPKSAEADEPAAAAEPPAVRHFSPTARRSLPAAERSRARRARLRRSRAAKRRRSTSARARKRRTLAAGRTKKVASRRLAQPRPAAQTAPQPPAPQPPAPQRSAPPPPAPVPAPVPATPAPAPAPAPSPQPQPKSGVAFDLEG